MSFCDFFFLCGNHSSRFADEKGHMIDQENVLAGICVGFILIPLHIMPVTRSRRCDGKNILRAEETPLI